MTRRVVAYVESAEEQLDFLVSRFGSSGTWSVEEQRMATGAGDAMVERTTIRTSAGAKKVEFRDARPNAILTAEVDVDSRSSIVEAVMERAGRFAAENPPHHPGSLPRFPIPIEHYERAVGVPLPILAVDDRGRRGLFSAPRMAVVSWSTMEPIGVRELDGFDPAEWPPSRLGDWPAPSVSELGPGVLEASIRRFGAGWSRIIDDWFAVAGSAAHNQERLYSDVEDALRLRVILDLPAMAEMYRSMNPRFARWLERSRS